MVPGLLERVAGAPISWGVCEVPGWGHQLRPERVLSEMRQAGLAASELGPEGFLPGPPRRQAALLASYGLRAVGGFVPVVLHQPADQAMATIAPVLEALAAAGAATLVLAAATGLHGYDQRADLDGEQWKALLGNLDRIRDAAAERSLEAVLHPHVGTIVERPDEVERVLDGCSIPLCLDSGHLLIGGTDPAQLAARAADRVGHAHLKDVDEALAARARSGELTYTQAVAAGMYRPLGSGDVDIAGVVRSLEAAGYRGWYVLEQDTILSREPAPGAGPLAEVRASLAFLRELAP